jgi:hypothetical protein
MNYSRDEQEYMEYISNATSEKMLHPCDVAEGVYMLVDDASPSEPPVYFRSLKGAVSWAEGSYPFSDHGEWSVYIVGKQVL